MGRGGGEGCHPQTQFLNLLTTLNKIFVYKFLLDVFGGKTGMRGGEGVVAL